jgi:hypothetical protein
MTRGVLVYTNENNTLDDDDKPFSSLSSFTIEEK